MDLPPQPPPDVPAPPPGPEAIRSRRIKWKTLCFALATIAIASFLMLPLLFPPRHGHVEILEVSHLRQIDLNLFAFEEEYGRFPDASTIPAVKEATGTTLALGDSSSNELFRQLIATVGRSEKIFWAKTATTPRKPDDILGDRALLPGECSFTYISGLTRSDDPDTPIVMAPVVRGTQRFDPKPFDGRAIVLFLDSSAITLPIDKNGEVLLNGMNLFDPRQPFWRGKAPDIKYPE